MASKATRKLGRGIAAKVRAHRMAVAKRNANIRRYFPPLPAARGGHQMTWITQGAC